VFDLILRDETESVKKRELRKHCQKNTSPDSTPRSVDGSTALAITKVQRCSVPGGIPNALSVNPEDAALFSWFNHFILLHRDSETQRGYLESLVPVYASARPGSPVSLATSAVAIITFARRPQYRQLLAVGLKTFGNALALTRKALQDPLQSKEDETLMAVLLLSMIEGLLALTDKKRPSNAHSDGALALVRHRGRDNFKTDISRRLFASVQTQTVSRAMKESIPPEKLLENRANVMEIMPCNAANRLTLVEGQVARLLSLARCLFGDRYTVADSELVSLACSATDVQKKLVDWACTVPKDWTPKPARDKSPATLSKFQAYSTRMDIYPDVWVVSIWNTYRILHITVQIVITTCETMRKAMCRTPSDSVSSPATIPNIIQELIDDICASVPFCLGDRTKGEPDASIQYPCAEGLGIPIDHQRAAVSLSGWFLIGPIKGCLMVGGLQEAQFRWLQSQRSRIASFYGSASLQEVDASPYQMLPFSLRFSQQALRGSQYGSWTML